MIIDEELRYRVLYELEKNPHWSQRELAKHLGLSLGKANYCLRAFVDKGLVKARNFRNNKNKLSYAYMLTPSGIRARADATVAFLRRKQDEYKALELELQMLHQQAKQDLQSQHTKSRASATILRKSKA